MGIAEEGVGAYPREVTQQMVLNFLSNGAAINVLAKVQRADLLVVDVGVDAEFPGAPGLVHRKVRRGTRNMLREPAMTQEELSAALQAGLDLADDARRGGRDLVAIGEMGIGNTSAASAMAFALTGHPVSLVTGKGTGLDEAGHRHKVSVLESVMRRHSANSEEPNSPLDILRGVGGLEIAAMTGFMLGAARNRIAIVVDGFISTAAAAAACALEPRARHYMFAGHLSEEPGHKLLLAHIGLEPILQLNMRLGEASGAAMAFSVIESSVCLYREMATFQSAGVSGARG